MQQISANEFPENLQQLLTEVQRTKTPLTVTHEGKPLVVICPITTQPKRATFGAMKGSGEILGDLTLFYYSRQIKFETLFSG